MTAALAAAAIHGVPMSQPTTGLEQLRRLRELGLRVQVLAELTDVDTIDAARVGRRRRAGHRIRRRVGPGAEPLRRASRLMHAGALEYYENSLLTNRPLRLHHVDGRRPPIPLEIDRWLGSADETDLAALARLVAPVLDVGCGPGRVVAALDSIGVASLGIDIAETAVTLSRSRGRPAVRCDAFGPVPDEGTWASVVLLDGNIGIGGNPVTLLERTRQLLRPSGLVLVETAADPEADDRLHVRFTTDGPSFCWALVGLYTLRRYAARLDYAVLDAWSSDERTFALLRPLPRRD